jgi:hypothetical protein
LVLFQEVEPICDVDEPQLELGTELKEEVGVCTGPLWLAVVYWELEYRIFVFVFCVL